MFFHKYLHEGTFSDIVAAALGIFTHLLQLLDSSGITSARPLSKILFLQKKG